MLKKNEFYCYTLGCLWATWILFQNVMYNIHVKNMWCAMLQTLHLYANKNVWQVQVEAADVNFSLS